MPLNPYAVMSIDFAGWKPSADYNEAKINQIVKMIRHNHTAMSEGSSGMIVPHIVCIQHLRGYDDIQGGNRAGVPGTTSYKGSDGYNWLQSIQQKLNSEPGYGTDE